MVWTKVTGVAFALGAVLAFGLSAAAGLAPHKGTPIARQSRPNKQESKAEPRAVDLDPSPASQYRVLVKQHDNAMKAAGDAAQKVYNEVADQKTQQARVTEIYERLMPKPGEYSARFLALAERYPERPRRRGCLDLGCREVAADARLVGSRLQQDGEPSHGDPRSRPRRRASARGRSASS